MSPLSLRRYRAERLLRDQFTALRARVLAGVRRQLRAGGVSVDEADLEACYAQAWQGLYAAMLEGRQIANPTGWLMLVTFRRAIEDHRARTRAELRSVCTRPAHAASAGAGRELETCSAPERDLADVLDDRMRLRQLFEGLRGRLHGREREAATLCYLQGLSRAQAAARMGVSDARMRKLMDGQGPGRPGVAGKVGALVTSIRDGDWCHEQGSLMRALAYGMLDPGGERYRLALMHHEQCPACRAYVVSLRGLAAALPPVFLPGALGAALLAHVAEGAHAAGAAGAGAGTGAGAGGGAAAGAGGAGAGGGVVAGAGGAAVGGAAGGGWLLAGGPFSAKFAVGCLLALGIGAGCIALERAQRPPAPASHAHRRASGSHARTAALAPGGEPVASTAAREGTAALGSSRSQAGVHAPLSDAASASREFGPEQPGAVGDSRVAARAGSRDADESARTASLGSTQDGAGEASASESAGAPAAPSSAGGSSASSGAGDSAAAEREFAPG